MALFLAGCGGSGDPTDDPAKTTAAGNETNAPSADDPYAGQFRVGHGRVNITPKDSMPLAGYGNTERRMSTGFLDYIYATCFAITDENNDTLLVFAVDIINANTKATEDVKAHVSAATGVPADHIILNATHTHSSIDQLQTGMKVVLDWLEDYKNYCVEAARAALADRLPAKMFWTTADLTGYNFVRHYFTQFDEAVGSNHGSWAVGTINRHDHPANPTMFILKFEREGAKDIMLANWRAHNTRTGDGSSRTENQKTNISSDWTGQIRANIEKYYDTYFAYFQGDSGNVNSQTSLPESIEKHAPANYKDYGREIAEIMEQAIDAGMEEIQTGPIQIVGETFTAKTNKSELEHTAEANAVRSIWLSTSDYNQCLEADPTHYIQSPYHANSIIARASYPETGSFYIVAGRIGDFAFTQAPFETFDTNGDYVRENSPSKYTMVMGYSNESHGYLPSAQAYDFGCYESDTAWLARGTGEDLAARFVAILNELYKK
ncbi:MAG: hypothetical protein J6Z38_02545 [Lachnospiraceae bacterium]|nr:hypothetical protein [Lachnospiraceae bacterium]